MRDILTIIASIVIVILAVAVAAPPFIDWQDHRETVDRLISGASGTEAKTEGAIGVRLLPTPRIRLDRLRLGGKTPDSPTLVADFAEAELALTPLLRGEVRFLETRIGRADIAVSVAGDGSWQLPPELLSGSARGREWAIESLNIAQLLVTTEKPSTGRTDQVYAENVSISGQKLIGPWRIEGSISGLPFRLVTGELAPDKSIHVKLAGGGDSHPRFDIDAKVSLTGGAEDTVEVEGKAKILLGPPAQVAAAGIPIPITLEASFKTSNGAITLDPVSLEAGEGGASLRMSGQGSIQIAEPRISLKMAGRRLDADSFILSANGQDFKSRFREWSIPVFAVPVDLDLAIDSIGLGQDDLSNTIARFSLDRGKAKLDLFEFTAPGETRVALEGRSGAQARGGGTEGRVALQSKNSDRFARYLDRLNLRSPFLRVLDGRPFEASSDVTFLSPVVSFNGLRIKVGEAVVTGNVRYTSPEGDTRAKLEAQVAIQNLNLDHLPRVSSVFEATQNMDVGFILDARGVTAGNRPGNGRIGARILSDGYSLLVESLDIVNVAGANAKVSGRIAPDGSGRIAGKVTAERAAPLVDLIGSVWIGGISRLVPPFLREGNLDLDVVTERVSAAAGASELRLRTTARGTAAGGSFDGKVDSVDGRTEKLDLTLATDNTGRWVERPDVASLKRASKVVLQGVRTAAGQFNVTLAGDVGGVQVSTGRPFTLSADDDVVDSGAAEIVAADITPFLLLLGDGAGINSPVPVRAQVNLGRERDATLVELRGQVAASQVQARLAVRSRADIEGEISLDKLSLPWLVTTLALNSPPVPGATAIWSTAKFGQSARILHGGEILIRAGTLDLGRDLRVTRASFTLEATEDGIALARLEATLGTGTLTGSARFSRQGALASVVGEGALNGVALSSLTVSPFEARLTGGLKFGSAGESPASLVANLGGSGEWSLTNVRIPQADPQALDRAARQLLSEEEPLVAGRAEAVITAELNKAALIVPEVTTSAALIAGVFRLSPVVVEGGASAWRGAVSFDLRSLVLDARGALRAKAAPPEWTGALPSVGVTWTSIAGTPFREIDAGPFRNGLAAIVLKRELEKIEAFERAAAERQRQLQARQEAERLRARVAAEEAERQAKAKAEAERARREAERIQAEQRNREQSPPLPGILSPAQAQPLPAAPAEAPIPSIAPTVPPILQPPPGQ